MIKLGNNSIGKVYLGSNEIGKAYLGSNLVYQKGGPVVTTIPYIRGGGNGSYIDTGITPDNTTEIIVWARNFNVASGQLNWLFGARPSSNDLYCDLSIGRNLTTGSLTANFGSSSVRNDDAWRYISHYHKYKLSADGLYVDDTQLLAGSPDTFSISENIHLFGYNAGGTNSGSLLPADIFACKIYKNGVLVRDYTPISSPSVGLYDAVSDTVFTNAGTGSFTYGTFDENAYTPLEYITCSGSQYFDTGLKGGYAVPWVFVFTPTGTEKVNTYQLGAQTSSSSGRCGVSVGNTTYTNGRLYFPYQSAGDAVKSTNTNNYFTSKKIVYVKNNNVATAYVNNTQEGTVTGASGSSFETAYNLFVGAMNNAGSATGGHIGHIYYCGMGTNRNYVPAKVNDVAGMYDTYNDVFKPSISGTDFIAGPEL